MGLRGKVFFIIHVRGYKFYALVRAQTKSSDFWFTCFLVLRYLFPCSRFRCILKYGSAVNLIGHTILNIHERIQYRHYSCNSSYYLAKIVCNSLWSNLCCYIHEQEVHDYLKSLCPSLHITRGEYDEDARYPETKTLTIGQFKLGLCHGHQV